MKVVLLFAAALLGISHARLLKFGNKVFTPTELFSMQPVIVGGTNAERDEFPYQISYRADRNGTFSHNCGGSILNDLWILTAAHCVEPKLLEPGVPQILAGILRLQGKGEFKQERRGVLIIRHPGWDLDTLQNDIALIKLDKALKLNEHVQPISLLNEDQDPPGELTVSGWGLTEMNGDKLPDNLQKVDIIGVQRSLCAQMFEMIGAKITEGHVCAGVMEGGKGVCQGDSGGPLVQASSGLKHGGRPSLRAKNQYEQLGIVSFGLGCAFPVIPAVFTNVPFYVDWIKESIAKNS